MLPICLVLSAHEAYAPRPYNYFDVGRRHDYFDVDAMRRRLSFSARGCYEPAAALLERLLERHPSFAFSLALSGPLLDQLPLSPEPLASFRRLLATGRVEPLNATSHHCLAWAPSAAEIEAQLRLYASRARRVFGREPAVFGGEDPNDPAALAEIVRAIGLEGMVLDGADLPAGISRRRYYRAPSGLPIMVAEKQISGELEGRHSPRFPLPAEKLNAWLSESAGDILCISLNLSTLGLRNPRETGILDFLEDWLGAALRRPGARFLTASEALAAAGPAEGLPPQASRAPAANEMQRDALERAAALVERISSGVDPDIAEDLRRLTSSDRFADMTLRAAARPDASDSPYESYMALRHALADLERRLARPRTPRGLSAGPSPA